MNITSSIYLISSPSQDKCPKPDKPEYAFVGRSNVGKSSLINMLCNKSSLAKTSASPGKTQLINHFLVNDKFYIVDLPGYGFAKVSQSQRKQWERMIEDYLRKRQNLVNLFLIIDGRHVPQQLDLNFIDSLGKWRIPFSLVFTKADKVSRKVLHANISALLDKLGKTWEPLPDHFVTSTTTKLGKGEILGLIERLNNDFIELKEMHPKD
ncbi:MAG TPA: ribosome biogenesis GTP-binding protein YihA/YsxC [Puia sp.]|nr:ribosome biogenesis GTP-binding protein YihA/YsxC [Puia sp.]